MESILDHDVVESIKSDFSEQDEWKESSPTSRQIKKRIVATVVQMVSGLKQDTRLFTEVEQSLVRQVFALGRLFLAYYFAVRQERSSPDIRWFRKMRYQKRKPQSRMFGTWFGKVRYWRTYMRRTGGGGGVYPLDLSLGLTADSFSLNVLSLAAKLATVVSYDRVTGLLLNFLSWSPCKTTVEHTVLGLGRYTENWFSECPPPEGDGDVLVIQIDLKAAPTATQEELRKRRGKRKDNPYPDSPRHRGREKRARRGSKPRKKRGDKSKNGKAASLVVMYTLKRGINEDGEIVLKGPINKKIYASFQSKRHAFFFARREANRRGFTEDSGKTIQIVTDGDKDFEDYIEDFFPEAIHTIDIMHVIEYLWEAGICLYGEGTDELSKWANRMKDWLYDGKASKVVKELDKRLEKIPKTGPGNKQKRKRVSAILRYLDKRVEKMNYDWLTEQDLELATGSVEGAARHVVGERFDCGGMRWIKERAQALLQLRCIEINGDWDAFISFVHDKLIENAEEELESPRLLKSNAAPIPMFDYAA